MQTKLIAAGVIVVVTVASFLLTFTIWPNPPGAPTPPDSLRPLFAVLGLIESLAFGAGVAFLIFGGQLVARAGQSRPLTIATYLSIGWLLVNWWPHGNLHRVNGFEFYGLLRIDYGFHVTLILAGLIVAFFFLRVLSTRPAAAPVSAR